MTVAELVAELLRHPTDMEVCTADDYFGRPVEILYVKKDKAEVCTMVDGERIRAMRDVVVIH